MLEDQKINVASEKSARGKGSTEALNTPAIVRKAPGN